MVRSWKQLLRWDWIHHRSTAMVRAPIKCRAVNTVLGHPCDLSRGCSTRRAGESKVCVTGVVRSFGCFLFVCFFLPLAKPASYSFLLGIPCAWQHTKGICWIWSQQVSLKTILSLNIFMTMLLGTEPCAPENSYVEALNLITVQFLRMWSDLERLKRWFS